MSANSPATSYPPPPWSLQGYGLQTLQLLDRDRVAASIPADLEIVSVLPGKTLGGVYVAAYTEGSTLLYNELIVVSAIVRCAGQVGAWISHIYVDNPESVAGGREIWGLPKELAEFTWEKGKMLSVEVKQADRVLCQLTCKWQVPAWQQSISGRVFSTLNSQLMQFMGQGTLKPHFAQLDLHIPAESRFAELAIGRPLFGFYINPLQLKATTPAIVQEKQPVQV